MISTIYIHRKIFQINPNDIDVMYNKASTLTALKKYEEVIEYFKILLLDPTYVYALYGKATVSYEQGKFEKALEYYDNII